MVTMIRGQQPTFDVASIKLVNLASHPVLKDRGGPGTSDPGRIHMIAWGMFWLIMKAYDVEIDQIVGPPWIMENSGPNVYQIDATMSPRTTKAQYQLMLQQLLQERFGLRIHREKRRYRTLTARSGFRHARFQYRRPSGQLNGSKRQRFKDRVPA